MTDAERIADAVERIKLATAGVKVNERAVRRLARRLSRWLRRCGVRYVHWSTCFWWYTGVWGFHDRWCRGDRRPTVQELSAIANHVVESVEKQAKDWATWGDDAYRARHKLEEVLRKLEVL